MAETLIIGGTRFVGRHITDALLARGHSVTHFNRGRAGSAPDGVTTIHGDRKSDLGRLGQRRWDAVIDTCGFTPDVVEHSARYFAQKTGRYVFISSISVYDLAKSPAPDEDAPLMVLPRGANRAVLDLEHYGALKALCEVAVTSTFRHRATIMRPGLIAGPYDATDRFTYWPVRIEAGDDVLLPETQHRIQYVDARDVADFCVRTIENGIGGTYNCVTPPGLTFGDLFDACSSVSRSGARAVPVSDAFLLENKVEPWSELPLWVPTTSEYASIANAAATRALVQGFAVRSLRETARDTLQWSATAGKRFGSLAAGLSPQRERELLELTAPAAR